MASSTLLIDERFASGDPRFLDELYASEVSKKLWSFAATWFRDPRPWARAMLLRYVDDGCDRAHHRGLVRQLFQLAEAAGDDELMAHFAVAFDRLVRHELREHRYTDWQTGQQVTKLWRVPAEKLPVRQPKRKRPEVRSYGGRHRETSPRFSVYTRQYLRRRALRYFRRMGFREPARFGPAARRLLCLYRDEHLQRPEQLLDGWSLLHLLYRESPVLVRKSRGIFVAEGRSLGELTPAPMHAAAWRDCLPELLRMLPTARSRFVRRWVVAWLREQYVDALDEPRLDDVLPLLRSAHEDVQIFGAELLEKVRSLAALPLAEWLALLDIDNPLAIDTLAGLVAANVTPDRLDLRQCVLLANAHLAPVAELGLRWAWEKGIRDKADLTLALDLALGRCPVVRARAAAWLGEHIRNPALGEPLHVRELLDAPHADVRAVAMALVEGEPRFAAELPLWAAAAESPHPEVRALLLRHLSGLVGRLDAGSVTHLWATTLLSVHRGNRDKRLALRQVAARVAEQPGAAAELVRLLAILLRSVRPAERRAALAAVATAAFRAPELRAAIAAHMPELTLFAADDGPQEAIA